VLTNPLPTLVSVGDEGGAAKVIVHCTVYVSYKQFTYAIFTIFHIVIQDYSPIFAPEVSQIYTLQTDGANLSFEVDGNWFVLSHLYRCRYITQSTVNPCFKMSNTTKPIVVPERLTIYLVISAQLVLYYYISSQKFICQKLSRFMSN
jgi:hypothetical protein